MQIVKWVIVFGLVLFAGCLDASLTSEEQLLCVQASSATANDIPHCNSLQACQELVLKQFPQSVGSTTGTNVLLQQAGNHTASAWWHTNLALQKLELVHRACQNGTLGEILDYSKQAGTELGAVLYGNEQALVKSLSALQQSANYASKLGLENVRDTPAFVNYAEMLQITQELKTGSEKNVWAQQLRASKEYFLHLSTIISSQKPAEYQLNTDSGMEWIKTPLKIVNSTDAKTIIAFSPIWQSLIGSLVTRKSASTGLILLHELKAEELLKQIEIGVGKNGARTQMVLLIQRLEESIHALEEGEQTHMEESREWVEKLSENAQAARAAAQHVETLEQEIQKWEVRLRIAKQTHLLAEEFDSALEDLVMEREILLGKSQDKKETLGLRVLEWRKWIKEANALENKIENSDVASETLARRCKTIAKVILENKEVDGITKLAANEVVSSSKEKTLEYCGSFMDQLASAYAQTVGVLSNFGAEEELQVCVSETNAYMKALDLQTQLTVEQLVRENGEKILAVSTCRAALLNVRQTYESSAAVQDFKKEINELIKLKEALKRAARITNDVESSPLLKEISEVTAKTEKVFTRGEIERKIEGIQMVSARAKERIMELIQKIAEEKSGEKYNAELTQARIDLKNGDFEAAEATLHWIEQNFSGQSNSLISDSNWMDQKSAKVSELDGVAGELKQATEKIARYSQALGVTCKQLAETGYICPLSENQQRDLKEEMVAMQKEIKEKQKIIGKIKTKEEWNNYLMENSSQTWNRVREIDKILAEAQSVLEEGANQTASTVKRAPENSDEWKDAENKMSLALEKKEFGKAIYIGRNLLQFSKSANAITGLSVLPEKAWPLVGVVLLVGGAGIYNWWKKKNAPAPLVQFVPKQNQLISLPLKQEKKPDEFSVQPQMKESPAAQQRQTKQ